MKITYRTARSYFLFTCFSLTLGLAVTLARPVAAEKSQQDADAKGSTVSPALETKQTTVSNPSKTSEASASTTKNAPKTDGNKPDAASSSESANSESDKKSAEKSGSEDNSGSADKGDSDKQAGNVDKQNTNAEETLTVPKPRRKKVPTFLGPNQKYSIAGFAEQAQTKIVDDGASNKPAFHRVQMRVTGSMCYACLLEFQEKLLQIYGIERARVAKSEQISVSAYSPAMANWADAILFYDASKLDLLDLRAYMRGSGYYPYKMVDKEVAEVPPAEQKRI